MVYQPPYSCLPRPSGPPIAAGTRHERDVPGRKRDAPPPGFGFGLIEKKTHTEHLGSGAPKT